MSGQGRPQSPLGCTAAQAIAWLVGLAGRCARRLRADVAAAATELDVRVRIAWGGGEARPWQGTISLSEGTLSEVTPLGLEPDAPGSMLLLDPATVRIFRARRGATTAATLRVQAPANAKLLVQLWTAEARSRRRRWNCRWPKSLRDFTQFDLDDRSNRLLAQRSPGDALRVSFDRDVADLRARRDSSSWKCSRNTLELTPATTYLLAASLGAGPHATSSFGTKTTKFASMATASRPRRAAVGSAARAGGRL